MWIKIIKVNEKERTLDKGFIFYSKGYTSTYVQDAIACNFNV
jgi:hypothetical protein